MKGSQHLTIHYRRPEPADGSRIWEVVQKTGVLDVNSAYCYMMMCRNFRETCVVAEKEDQIVGFVTAYVLPDQPDTLFVWQIGIAPDEQGQGIGKNLLTQLEQQLSHRSISYWETTISPSNTASRALFASYAKARGAKWNEQEGFRAALFPTDEHEEEKWIRIGPL
ncbi:diaminobutyrate acetyltransferase [Paenibacillus senegalensis]|uniref:diaminobutyrate acetyltransferase n=1 Tax=Paenibacillus senegalensis TaxID=1465766 RepID=UPI000288B5AB|nr:diaminobutyrate acetyltransferase [Paenibacillus senegalensis]